MPGKSQEKSDDCNDEAKIKKCYDEGDYFHGYDQFNLEIAGLGDAKKDKPILCMSAARARIVFGLIIVILIAISWVGATQFANKTYSASFSAPFFTTWYTTSFMIVVFPIFSIPQMFKKRPWRFKSFFRESATIFGTQGICLISLIKYILPFCTLWLGSNYLYISALEALNPADVTAVFSSVSAFVYIFSMIFLKERFFITRLAAVLLSIGGIVLFASRYGFKGANVIGVVLTVFAAVASALYQVMFKRLVGNATGSQVALFLTLLGLCNVLLFWLIILPIHFTGYELIDWSNMPWRYLNGGGLLMLIFNYLINFGIAFTSPLFVALGTMLGIPLNAVADYVFNKSSFGIYKIFGALMILLGFLLMLLSSETLIRWEQKLLCVKQQPDTPVDDRDDDEDMLDK